jgi:type VI secretion system protein ImpB
VEALRKLFEARGRLNDLLAKLDGNDVLDELLQSVLENTDQLKEVQDQVVEARPEEAEGEAEEEEEA